MSKSNDLYMSELEKANEMIEELTTALENLCAAILRNTNGMPDWLSKAMDFSDEIIAKVRNP